MIQTTLAEVVVDPDEGLEAADDGCLYSPANFHHIAGGYMKTKLLFLIMTVSVIFNVELSSAQWNWVWRNPQPTGNAIFDCGRFRRPNIWP